MALKDMMKALVSKKEKDSAVATVASDCAMLTSADFPILRASEVEMSRYRRIPLMELGALGAAFSTLPEAARTITQIAETRVATNTPLYIGLWPEGVKGQMIDKGLGLVGNITDDKGRIVARMRFRPVDNGLPVTTSTTTTIPYDPMSMVMAAALISIEKKLDVLQERAEEILQFLKLDKQSKQRGNLNLLAEIVDEYRRDGNNDKMCALRVIAVQDIKREAHQDILFYQEQIAHTLQEQKAIHSAQKAQSLLDGVVAVFYEYKLANYLYAYTSFMELMLQKNFDASTAVADRIDAFAQKYRQLYTDCRTQIAHYQRTAIEAQLIGGLGHAAKTVGKKMSAVPILRRGAADEALINAGESLGKRNREAVTRKLDKLTPLEDAQMGAFIDNIRSVHLLMSRSDAMITDGENLYIMETA